LTRRPFESVRSHTALTLPVLVDTPDRRVRTSEPLALRLVTGHCARIVDDGEGPLGVGGGPRQGPELHALGACARTFLRRHGGLGDRDGDLVDAAGRRVGRHRGHHQFTVGQRRGIGVSSPEALYVLSTDAGTNTVTIGTREQLATQRIEVRDALLHRDGARIDRVRLRYHSAPLPCRVSGAAGPHDELVVTLAEPAFGVAPGQTASLLSGEAIVGHGTIISA
jgi:tRNA-specific 2-thiouridylase